MSTRPRCASCRSIVDPAARCPAVAEPLAGVPNPELCRRPADTSRSIVGGKLSAYRSRVPDTRSHANLRTGVVLHSRRDARVIAMYEHAFAMYESSRCTSHRACTSHRGVTSHRGARVIAVHESSPCTSHRRARSSSPCTVVIAVHDRHRHARSSSPCTVVIAMHGRAAPCTVVAMHASSPGIGRHRHARS